MSSIRKSTQRPAEPAEGGLLWTDMTLGDFGHDASPVQESLFPEPDACGTLDLFDGFGE